MTFGIGDVNAYLLSALWSFCTDINGTSRSKDVDQPLRKHLVFNIGLSFCLKINCSCTVHADYQK